MLIKNIKLENIRSYTSEKIEFPLGKTLLSGDIGSGKSTILLAIEFALFGINKSELSGKNLLRHGHNSGSVELCFQINNEEYIIKRTLKRNKENITQENGYILKDNKKFEGTATELKAKIIEILGYPEELITKSKTNIYRYTVYCPQEEMKKILYEDSETRLDTLRKLFNLDKYKKIRENADFYARELRRKTGDLNLRIENYKEIEEKIKNQKNRIDELEKNIENEQIKLNKTREKIKIEKEKYQEIEQKIKKLNDLKKDLEINENLITTKKNLIETLKSKKETISKKIDNLELRLKNYKDITEIKPEKEIENDLNKLLDDYNEYIKQKSIQEQKLKNYSEQLKKIEQEINEINEKTKKELILKKELLELEEKIKLKKKQQELYEEHKQKQNLIKIKIEKCLYKIEESKRIIENIKNAEICPLCFQKVDLEHKKEVIEKELKNIEEKEKEKKQYLEIDNKITENINKIKKNLEKLEKLESIYKEKKEKQTILLEQIKNSLKKQKELSEYYLKKQEIEEALNSLEKSILKKEIDKKRKILSEIRDYNLKVREKKNIIELIDNEKENLNKLNNDINQIENQIKDIEEKKLNLISDIKNYKNIENEFLEQKIKYENQKEIEKQIEIELSSLKKEKTILTTLIRDDEKKLDSLNILKAKIQELKNIEGFISEFFINLMITLEKHIMYSIHKEFEELLKEWYSMLIEGIDIELEDDFSVKIIQDGYETTIDNLSGGEKTAVALSYRLAINKVINDIIPNIKTKDFIILDEPTDGFSSEQLDKVRDVLDQLNINQTIIVSHESKMESYVEHIIRINKENNISKISL